MPDDAVLGHVGVGHWFDRDHAPVCLLERRHELGRARGCPEDQVIGKEKSEWLAFQQRTGAGNRMGYAQRPVLADEREAGEA